MRVNESDEALYERLLAGETRAFDRLYERYERRLFGFVMRQLDGDRAEAEDVFHEAFLGMLRSRKVDLAQGSFRAWLFQIARNLCLNRVRSRTRGERAIAAVPLATEPAADARADETLSRHQATIALDRAVKKLPLALAEVYELRASGLSYEEMSQVLGAPLGTVKSRMHEAVSRLKKEMEPWTAG